MIAWSRRHTLAAGIALIALTNAIALIGVAYNRGGEPEALLRLTDRELGRSVVDLPDTGESSGVSLRLRWRTPSELRGEADLHGSAPGMAREPLLDARKLAALGFDLSASPATEKGVRRLRKQLPREAMLVLEMEGPAWRRELELRRARAVKLAAESQAAPEDKALRDRAQAAQNALSAEERSESRLFVIDAGTDAARLRAKYPDRARHAIVRGEVGLSVQGSDEKARVEGTVGELSVAELQVPLEFRAAALRMPAPSYVMGIREESAPSGRFEVTVAWGRRFEPWVVAMAEKQK